MAGKPVVVLAVVFQHPPSVLLMRQQGGAPWRPAPPVHAGRRDGQAANGSADLAASHFDTLAQLPNRRMFHERLRHALAQGRRDTSRVGVRETNTVARLGGDEFTVILSDLDDLQQVDRIARQILDGLLAPFLLGQEQAFVSASIGITVYPDDAGTIEDLLKHADQAMYVSKGAGRNRYSYSYSYFTPAMQVAAVNRMRMGADLRTALREQPRQLHSPKAAG